MNGMIAVIMSVYYGDNENWLDAALNSIFCQTYGRFDVYLQVDGYVDVNLIDVIERYESEYHNLYVEYIQENRGLAWQLNRAIERAFKNDSYMFFARMDADDISAPNRFEVQIDFLKANPDVYIVGSDVMEIDSNGNPIFYKKMEPNNNQLVRAVIKKCPFNHPTVMFRESVFSSYKLRYKDYLTNTQDYYLWVDAIHQKLSLANINKPLLKFRVDDDFHKRRGLKKSINEFCSRIYAMKKLEIFNFQNITHSVMLLLLRLSPSVIKRFAYNKLR